MSFRLIERTANHGSLASGVAVGAVKTTQGIKFRLRFAPDVLNAMNWSSGCYLSLAYGEGHHAGKLRIGADELNGFKLQKGTPNDRSKFLNCTRIGDGQVHKRAPIPHKISDGYLYIDLPDWAQPSDED